MRAKALLTEALGSEIVVHFGVAAEAVTTEDVKELAEDSGLGEGGIQSMDVAGTKFVASFSPRSRVRTGDDIEVGVDTARLYYFDLDSGLAIRA